MDEMAPLDREVAEVEDPVKDKNEQAKGRKAKPRKSKPVAPNSFRLGYLIHDVSRMRQTLVDQHMKPAGITRSQWWVLANLSRHGSEGIMSTELAKLMDVGKVTLGGLIDRLEIAGYVYRRADEADRRAKHIFITEAGYTLIERMKIIVTDLNDKLCEGLTQTDVAETELNLIRLKDNLRELLGEHRGDGDSGGDI